LVSELCDKTARTTQRLARGWESFVRNILIKYLYKFRHKVPLCVDDKETTVNIRFDSNMLHLSQTDGVFDETQFEPCERELEKIYPRRRSLTLSLPEEEAMTVSKQLADRDIIHMCAEAAGNTTGGGRSKSLTFSSTRPDASLIFSEPEPVPEPRRVKRPPDRQFNQDVASAVFRSLPAPAKAISDLWVEVTSSPRSTKHRQSSPVHVIAEGRETSLARPSCLRGSLSRLSSPSTTVVSSPSAPLSFTDSCPSSVSRTRSLSYTISRSRSRPRSRSPSYSRKRPRRSSRSRSRTRCKSAARRRPSSRRRCWIPPVCPCCCRPCPTPPRVCCETSRRAAIERRRKQSRCVDGCGHLCRRHSCSRCCAHHRSRRHKKRRSSSKRAFYCVRSGTHSRICMPAHCNGTAHRHPHRTCSHSHRRVTHLSRSQDVVSMSPPRCHRHSRRSPSSSRTTSTVHSCGSSANSSSCRSAFRTRRSPMRYSYSHHRVMS